MQQEGAFISDYTKRVRIYPQKTLAGHVTFKTFFRCNIEGRNQNFLLANSRKIIICPFRYNTFHTLKKDGLLKSNKHAIPILHFQFVVIDDIFDNESWNIIFAKTLIVNLSKLNIFLDVISTMITN